MNIPRSIVVSLVLVTFAGCVDRSGVNSENPPDNSASATAPAPSPATPPVAPGSGTAPAATALTPDQQKQQEFARQESLRSAAKTGTHAALIARIDQLKQSPLPRPMFSGLLVPLPLSAGAPYLFHDDGDLRGLDLRLLNVTDADLQELAKLQRLETLYLAYTPVTDVQLGMLAPLPSLRELDLTGTGVSNAGLAAISKLPHLESLHLNDTSITDDGIETLGQFKSLKHLEVGGKLSADGKQRLAELLPMCTIQ
jgi:hypothetical protein